MRGDRLHIALVGPLHPRALAHRLVSTANIPDGPPTPVNELAEALLSLGHRVSIYTPSPAAHATDRLVGNDLDITFIPYRKRARDLALTFFRDECLEIEYELRNSEADIVHVHWTYELAFAAVRSRAKPLLVTAHDAPITILRLMPNAYRLIRTVMALRARFGIKDLTAVSPYLAQSWRKKMLYRRPISVIPNILPNLPVSTPARERGRFVILDVSNDSRLKNVRVLIRAFAIVVQRYPEAELRLVGPGLAADDPIAKWARWRRLEANVVFVGPVDRGRMFVEYAQASIFCHPSLEESFGVALIEALHSGLAVIAGMNSGAVPWVLFDGQAGRLVDVRSATAIAAAISEVIDDPSSSVVAGFDVVQAVTNRYGPVAVAAAYVAEYRRIIEADQFR